MNKRKKIVVFIDWFYPGFKAGGPVRSCYNLINQLKHEFDFYVITRDTDYCESNPYKNIESDKWNTISEGCSVYYFSSEKLNYKSLKQVTEQIGEVHRFYLNGMYSYFFSICPLLFIVDKKSIILAPRGMLAPGALSVKSFKKKLFITLAKTIGLYKHITFHATSKDEEADIKREINSHAVVKYAPNLASNVSSNTPVKEKLPNELRLIFLARISPEKNLLFALEILKNISADITFDLYGVINDQNYWSECKKLIGQMPPNIKVNYCGYVDNNDVVNTLNKYHFLFLPTKGENFGHAIIESLAAGCPVIISDTTPWKNLEKYNAGWELSLSNKDTFIKVLNECADMGVEKYAQMSNAAIKYAQDLSNNNVLEKNKSLFI